MNSTTAMDKPDQSQTAYVFVNIPLVEGGVGKFIDHIEKDTLDEVMVLGDVYITDVVLYLANIETNPGKLISHSDGRVTLSTNLGEVEVKYSKNTGFYKITKSTIQAPDATLLMDLLFIN